MATANTFVQIGSTVTVGGGGAANITFSSIPATYTDLNLVFSLRSSASGDWQSVATEINGTSTNYTSLTLVGYDAGTTGSLVTTINTTLIYHYSTYAGATASTFGVGSLYFTNYTASNSKSNSMDSVTENNSGFTIEALTAGLWANSAVITQLKLTPGSGGNWVEYSTASLYGILKY